MCLFDCCLLFSEKWLLNLFNSTILHFKIHYFGSFSISSAFLRFKKYIVLLFTNFFKRILDVFILTFS